MHSLKLCKQYLSFLNNGDMAGVLSVFTSNAVVVAPLSGAMAVMPFHGKFFADIKQSRTTIKNIFATVNDVSSVALHFSHVWLLADGGQSEFEGINIFELNEDGRKFSKLTIIYDSAPLRHRLGEIFSPVAPPFKSEGVQWTQR